MTNPFQPGPGLPPPLRVGHERAATFLAKRLEAIRDKGVGNIVVLYGPRGNGKTVLLSELQRKAGKKMRQPTLTTRMMAGDPDVVAREFAPANGGILDKIEGADVGAGGVKVGVKLRGRAKVTPWAALRATLKEGPVLLAVDEAHEMPVDFGQELLQATQDCVAKGLPLLVVLAGTPSLPAHLKEMHASFWERCRKLRIGRLETAKAVREALATPARKSGMPIDGDALERLVEESQRYPFFVQQLGHESWDAAQARRGARQITLKDVQKGIDLAQEELRLFHDERREEMEKRDVLGEAEAVSRILAVRGRDARITRKELMAAVRSVAVPNGRDPKESLELLTHLGLVWKTSRLDWEPGIPSLCAFLVEWADEPDPE